jgi:protein Mpv17
MLVDQLIFCPIFTAVFFAYNGYLEGGCLDAVAYKFRNAYMPTLLANYKLWPFVQLLNFYLIPLPFRAPFVNLVALGWSAYMSVLNAKHSLHDKTLIK